MKSFSVLLFSILLSATCTFAGEQKVAVVKLLKGEVDVLNMGKTTKLKAEDWVEAGAVVKTAEKSFVKLVFIDKSQMNIGPNSEMKIESFSGKDAGVIDLVKGKIRSQVTKDYLQMKDKDRSKLFIKTENAVMGVRGTDFMISTNGKNTSVVLFEGEVVFNKFEGRGAAPTALENVVERGVRLFPGEFSVVERERGQPTVPSLLNVQQRETLEKNENFESERGPSNSGNETAAKSVVPEGLNGQVVSNDGEALKQEMSQVAAVAPAKSTATPDSNPDGFVAGDKVKPANGSFLHVDSGVVIPPSPDSVLDPNTNTYIPSASNGVVGSDGNYVPPKNVEITNDGKILVAVKDASGAVQVQEVAKPAPVVTATNVSLAKVGEVIQANPQLINPTQPVSNDILNSSFSGGSSPVSSVINNTNTNSSDIRNTNILENVSNKTRTTIVVTPP